MLLLILLPWLTGTLLADRVLKLHEPVGALSVGWAAGWLYATMAINIALRAGFSLDNAIDGTLVLCLVVAIALFRQPGQGWTVPPFRPATWVFLAIGVVAVHLTANTILYLNPDDDYYLHSPLQGQLLKGTFPVVSPFFSDILYGGHYARDLLLVVMARLSGATIFGVLAPVTVTLQLAAFLVLFTMFARATGSQLQAILATASVFAGANAGFRGGWLDTLANNNALAQMISALAFLLTMEALFVRPSRGATVLAGITLGGLAWAYETNFAVVCLGLCGLAFSTFCLRSLQARQIKTALAIIAITLPLAVIQGGVFQNLLGKLVEKPASSVSEADPTVRTQKQEVSITFPKNELFKIKLDRSGEEMSMAYSTLPILRDLPKTAGTPGYVSIFSWYAIRIHWIALYLAPLSLLLLWRGKNWSGLLLWWVGCSGYVLPAVVSFGLFESEVFRWEYVASWGFAGALGVALGQWWQGLPGPILEWRAGLEVHAKGLAALLLGGLMTLNFYPSFHQMRQRTAQLDRLSSALLFPTASAWFKRQPELDLWPADYQAGLWLSQHASKDQRLLTNFREENEFNVYFESSFIGLCGLRPLGHTFPLPFERLGTRPFRLSAAARAFWSSLDPALLSILQADWVYLRGRPAKELEGLKGLELVHQEDGEHSVFKVASLLPLTPGVAVPAVRLGGLALPAGLEVEQYLRAELTLVNSGPTAVRLKTTFSYDLLDLEGKPVEPWERFEQPVQIDIPAAGEQSLKVHFVTPHQDGEYRLVGRLGPEPLQGEVPIKVGTRRLVTGLELVSAEPLDPLVAGQVANFRLSLRNPSPQALVSRRPILAALVPTDPERPLYEVGDFSELHLDIPAGGQVEVNLPVVVPEVMNGFELMLLPRDGWGIWALPPAR